MNGNMYNQKAGRLVATMCRSFVKSGCGELAFKTFFTPLYETLKRIRESKHCKIKTLFLISLILTFVLKSR